MTEKQRQLLPIIWDAINPETNTQHAFVAGVIYDRAMRLVVDKAHEKDD